ncbi:hypothetical protein SAMN04487785_11410 [Dyella jiangningensis]|uniref:hypothetical protein n=1 Tax=Dyella sp. AtDHG13 TaxID=1938897 RepID=UPI000891AD67|nr:hypothetical protein [Dyella sp. AtDHG13]PXV54210.1 hypothetical protein BDW41_113163 [Dyella sp. AtDHG13]SDL03908.1 hypothetical protein SAMN04487785_11410 [Dyella jiangningensis]
MSYCRFSSNDFLCDVYVYESCLGGWEIHVAANRVVFKEPLPDPLPWSAENAEACVARMRKVSAMVDVADRVDIDLPHAGESFNESSPGECADRLEYLRGLGYVVPQHAIDTLREEAEEAE